MRLKNTRNLDLPYKEVKLISRKNRGFFSWFFSSQISKTIPRKKQKQSLFLNIVREYYLTSRKKLVTAAQCAHYGNYRN